MIPIEQNQSHCQKPLCMLPQCWRLKNRIDYSPKGDTLASFSLKVKEELEIIYHLLRRLRRLDASPCDVPDSVAYQLHVDTVNGKLLIRDATNTEWIELGKLGENFFGITPEDIDAMRSGGGLGTLYGGNAEDLPTGANINDIFYAFDEKKMYWYNGTSWECCFSLDFGDLLNYEDYVITRDEVGYSGADKVLRLDKTTGKANVDITGSPDKILNYPIEVTDLKNGDVLMFDTTNGKIINAPKDEITLADISSTGEANKIVRLDSDRVIHADLDGKLKTARAISIVGDAEGTTYFDGSKDVEINLDVLNATNDGEGNNIVETYATKAGISACVSKEELTSILVDYVQTAALSTATVGAAQKLSTARNISLSGAVIGSASFDGTKDISLFTISGNEETISREDIAALF